MSPLGARFTHHATEDSFPLQQEKLLLTVALDL